MHESHLASRLAALAVLVETRAAAAHQGRAGSSVAALLTLRHRGAQTTTSLARTLGLSQPAATRLLDRLAEEGLVARPAPAARAGRREAPVDLTRAGMEEACRLQLARHAALAPLTEAIAELPGIARAGFFKGLDAMLSAAPRDREEARRLCRLCDHGVCAGPRCPIGRAAERIEAASQAPAP